jgi:hypothetical protein
MGILDKVKAAAEKAAAEAKKGTAQVQSKIEHGQVRKKADEAAKQLGYLIVAERTHGVPAGEDADRLVQEIQALQAQLEAEGPPEESGAASDSETPAASQSAPAAPAPPTSASEPTEGDFKLD